MEKFPVFVSKNTFKRHFDLLLIEKVNLTMFLSKILANSCTIKQYIVIENIFVVSTDSCLLLHKYKRKHVTDCFEINGKQMIKMAKK